MTARPRYRRQMMKITRKKLHVSCETIRALGTRELTHAVGGFDSGQFVCAAQADSGKDVCGAQADSGKFVCVA
jgi:hypothetical protein